MTVPGNPTHLQSTLGLSAQPLPLARCSPHRPQVLPQSHSLGPSHTRVASVGSAVHALVLFLPFTSSSSQLLRHLVDLHCPWFIRPFGVPKCSDCGPGEHFLCSTFALSSLPKEGERMVFGTQKLELELVHFLAPSFRIYVVVEKKKCFVWPLWASVL